ncbi:protein madd-4 isoform X3 [Diachasmimorpha longicaudata]|uniref:protein madd-4 isoform X3 n=1 Tax=Diachasmimorpha longicaudata TaxID=58733 RepID=UPI0030B91BDA
MGSNLARHGSPFGVLQCTKEGEGPLRVGQRNDNLVLYSGLLAKNSDFSFWKMQHFLLLMCLVGTALGENSTVDDVFGITSTGIHGENEGAVSWGEWSPWSKWSSCTRNCGGGISRQQRRCRRKPCKGKSWSIKYKICNNQPCQVPSDYRAEQCTNFDNVPYGGQLLKWYPYYDESKPCSLICRGVQVDKVTSEASPREAFDKSEEIRNKIDGTGGGSIEPGELESDETFVVQLADRVEDGTKCGDESVDVCIGGSCMKVGCDMRVNSGKTKDACGVCGGNGSSCQPRYSWSLESISACSKSCGGGFKMAMAICKSSPDDSIVDEINCNTDQRPTKMSMACNTHPCTTKWVTGDWTRCSTTCGGGSRTRAVFCTEENGNETTKLPDHRCNASHKPRNQEMCNTISCPMWETNQWSECSATCGSGVRTRRIECRDGNGRLSNDCDPGERPREEQECKNSVDCSAYSGEMAQEPYAAPPLPEKLIDQPVPSESTFIADEWSPCSATCGEGIRHRQVHCKIFLDFSRTIAKLPDNQCAGPKPPETERCMLRACPPLDNSLSYRIDTVGDSGYEESNLMDSYRSSGGSGSDYESTVKVAPGNSGQTTYSWKEGGYSACTASCLGGVQDLIINCVRDDTGKTVIPLLCTKETKPESRIRTCNDHACTPRWNYSDFSPCSVPCGIGIQTRYVTCIHEVARGAGNTIVVPNHMCQAPPPVDRQHCNVWDCPPEWKPRNWEKCSKSCGGGVKRREVVCVQVMAQGHERTVPDRECHGNKLATEKPCNTRACHEIGLSVQPVIFSQNSTFTQRTPEEKVDLKIGGIATVFQGIPMVKIRCPVKKFNKQQISWTKDRAEIRKSRKYKISKKGALKIVDIGVTDGGVYSCRAGGTRAELRLIVRHRTREQMSSEEILRFGNAVNHRPDINLDQSSSSGENLQIDHAAPAFQGAFAYGNDDQSHEFKPEIPSAAKPTKKSRARNRRPKTSPPPPDGGSPGEFSVTSIHQSYWPFQGNSGSSRNHRTVTSPDENPHEKKRNLRYDSGEKDFSLFNDNTVLPDEPFGPDEERIFIDDDPFDMNTAILSLDQMEEAKKSTESLIKVHNQRSNTKDTKDYLEESLKQAKRHKHGDIDNYLRNERGASHSHEHSKPPETDRYHDQTTHATVDTRSNERTQGGTEMTILVNPTNIPEDFTTSKREEESPKTDYIQASLTSTLPAESIKKSLETSTRPQEDDDRGFDSGSEMEQTEDSYETELTRQKFNKSDTIKLLSNSSNGSEMVSSNENAREMDSEGDDRGALEVLSTEDGTNRSIDIRTDLMMEIGRHLRNKSHVEHRGKIGEGKEAVQILGFDNDDEQAINVFSKVYFSGTGEDLVFEWVTTEWSKCSQTCGGGGFQMRGAQCTVRSNKLVNSTRVPSRSVIGASLCEDAGFPVPQKVRACGSGRCPQWHAGEWTPCESSRCFNWKTAMQRRDVTCRLVEDINGTTNVTILESSKCDDGIRPPQRQECYNDVCKGVWRVGEWSECTASCEEDGIKYRILQCVWFGTKKPAGNACRDIPNRPAVMKICHGAPCPKTPGDCEDHSPLCNRVKMMNMCQVPLYQKQCCKSCH